MFILLLAKLLSDDVHTPNESPLMTAVPFANPLRMVKKVETETFKAVRTIENVIDAIEDLIKA